MTQRTLGSGRVSMASSVDLHRVGVLVDTSPSSFFLRWRALRVKNELGFPFAVASPISGFILEHRFFCFLSRLTEGSKSPSPLFSTGDTYSLLPHVSSPSDRRTHVSHHWVSCQSSLATF